MKRLYFNIAFGLLAVLIFWNCSSSKVSSNKKSSTSSQVTSVQPNVIFISVDDMNDFINPLGYSQAITPNLDRLAAMGTNFTNAHAPAAYCAPSRTAIWTGLQSTTTGCYRDEVYFYDFPSLVPIHEAFQQAGYNTYGAGKLFHHRKGHVDLDGWTKYYARNQAVRDVGFETGFYGDDQPLPNPYPYSPYYTKTKKKMTGGGKFLEFGPIAEKDVPKMMGVKRTKWITKLLEKKHKNPFFLGLGLYTPHFPNYAPKKYFDMYDLDKIKVPNSDNGDLNDLPPKIRRRMTNRSKIQKTLNRIGATKQAVRGYLAAVSYADGLLGEVLEALEKSDYRDNTIIMLWSDQGYHLGEKGNWGKHTLWSETSRVPFMIAGPKIKKGHKVSNTVGLIDIYPTLIDLCKLPKQHKMDGESLAPLLRGEQKEDKDLFIPFHIKNSYSVVNSNYRYIYHHNDGEEFYNLKEDYNEYNNLINQEGTRSIINQMKKVVPNKFRRHATSKKTLKLFFDENGNYYWKSKKGGKPQMNL